MCCAQLHTLEDSVAITRFTSVQLTMTEKLTYSGNGEQVEYFAAVSPRIGIAVLGLTLVYTQTDTQQSLTQTHTQRTSSRMHVMNHNLSAMKQCLHPQSVTEISRHSVLSRDRIRQCGTSSGSRQKDTDQCL